MIKKVEKLWLSYHFHFLHKSVLNLTRSWNTRWMGQILKHPYIHGLCYVENKPNRSSGYFERFVWWSSNSVFPSIYLSLCFIFSARNPVHTQTQSGHMRMVVQSGLFFKSVAMSVSLYIRDTQSQTAALSANLNMRLHLFIFIYHADKKKKTHFWIANFVYNV